jgi:hypothetical protein
VTPVVDPTIEGGQLVDPELAAGRRASVLTLAGIDKGDLRHAS